jgi:hypothetical protein
MNGIKPLSRETCGTIRHPMSKSHLREFIRSRRVVDTETGCWMWTGGLNNSGYGLIMVDSKHYSITKIVLWAFKGMEEAITNTKKHACHHCDTPGCVRPYHLFLGSARDNMADRERKKRGNESRKTHCKNGHPLSGTNLRIPKTGKCKRRCRICAAATLKRCKVKRAAREKSL